MAKSGKSRTTTAKSARRREELRRNLPRPATPVREAIQRPEFINTAAVILLFVLITSPLLLWSRDLVKVQYGDIMTETRVKRLNYEMVDQQATQAEREAQRKNAPRVYRLNEAYLNRLRASIEGLPAAVEGKTSLDQDVSEDLVNQFKLTDQALEALQRYSRDGAATDTWMIAVSELFETELREVLILPSEEYQQFRTTLTRSLLTPEDELLPLSARDAVEIGSANLEERLEDMIRYAGFPSSVNEFVRARLKHEPEATARHDQPLTEREARNAADSVEPVVVEHHQGDVLYRRGDILSTQQYADVRMEAEQWNAAATWSNRWLPRLSIVGLVLLVAGFMVVFTAIARPRILRKTLRVGAICFVMLGMLAASVLLVSKAPAFMVIAALAPPLFIAMVMMLAYDQRLAMVYATAQAVLTVVALEASVPMFVLIMAGCGAAIAMLHDVRARNSIIRAAAVATIVFAAGIVVISLVEYPIVEGFWRMLPGRAVQALVACFGVGFIVLGILPSIERMFDITTGMTLAELRDPKQPLLRQLQQKAPGTYNHSLQVASIAEAAADAIGADSLLVYVGALYHDIGKMNKPEYFIENQSGGENKHDKLSPAMSLLVIIGHVKDGIELAKEYALPRQIIHFIETHHGTTLVEYFYHAAKTQAEFDAKQRVDEIEFRYPGPKPRTKEAGIMMLSDAVESATRAMAEPNPGRIESLVRDLSRKRLMDGQFDHCDLTFRELHQIEDAIISRVNAIHHGRIAYPSKDSAAVDREPALPKAKTA